jgi:hypothetical protein
MRYGFVGKWCIPPKWIQMAIFMGTMMITDNCRLLIWAVAARVVPNDPTAKGLQFCAKCVGKVALVPSHDV